MKRILFVCTGNTCRSPMAEFILKNLLKINGIKNVRVSSCGLNATTGAPINYLAKAVLAENGISCKRFKSRQLTREIIQKSDIIICMTREHKSSLREISKAVAFSELYGINDIFDPYGGDIEIYRKCFFELKNACGLIIKEICERR